MLVGDFNIIRWSSESNAKNMGKVSMTYFNAFIQRNQLCNPPLSNDKYTWSNMRRNPTCSRIDSFLFTKVWEQNCNKHFLRTLVRTLLDYFLIGLETNQIKWGPCPFRLNNSSLMEKDFKKNIQVWWKDTT